MKSPLLILKFKFLVINYFCKLWHCKISALSHIMEKTNFVKNDWFMGKISTLGNVYKICYRNLLWKYYTIFRGQDFESQKLEKMNCICQFHHALSFSLENRLTFPQLTFLNRCAIYRVTKIKISDFKWL